MENKRLICTKPFEWLEISNDKNRSAYLCCSSWLNVSAGATQNFDETANKNVIETVWKGKLAKAIRRSVIDGTFSYCNGTLCPHLTSKNGPVKYVSESEWQGYVDLIKSDREFYPQTLNCAYDRSCNLACPTCRTELIMSDGSRRTTDMQYITSLIEQFQGQIGEIYITGSGDPFGSRHYWDLLTGDVLRKYSNIKLRIHTNAQMLNLKRWEKIQHLASRISRLEVSIDGACDSTYEINRYPGKWDVLLENMELIADLRKKNVIPYLKLDYVVQKNNWREMDAFVELGSAWNADAILFLPINNWGTFSDEEYKARAVHFSENIEHESFVSYLRSSSFRQNKIVELGSLRNL